MPDARTGMAQKRAAYSTAAMLLLVAVATAAVYLAVNRYAVLRDQGSLKMQHRVRDILRIQTQTPKPDATYVRSWMTFEYLNRIFSLPPTYFSKKLHITDPSYPKMSIARYAVDARITTNAALLQVIAALKEYVGTTKAPATP